MKVGMVFYAYPSLHTALDSIRYVAQSLMDAVVGRHDLVFLPPEYVYCSDERTRKMSDEFVQRCDVLVGLPSEPILAARQRVKSNARFVGFLLGVMPRGAWPLKDMLHLLTTDDVLVANCTAELELAIKFFFNAQVRVIPFAFSRRVFYPLDNDERSVIRGKLGFMENDRILLYAGRVTLEKNLHTLLRIFSAVQRLLPDACLVIAGPTMDSGFPEFGVASLNLANTLKKIISKLRIPEGRVRLIGHADGDRVRELYNIADVAVNMTLHHDENFGLAQVEAMACGTPAIGTAWGGLKDTIVNGTSGYTVSTVPTPSGVRVNWWEAVNRIVGLLQDSGGRERFRESCVRHAEHYSQARFDASLMEILSGSSTEPGRPAQVLKASAFAEEFWRVCNFRIKENAPYRRGRRSYELYQELMVSFTHPSPEHVSNNDELLEQHILCLAAPISDDGERRFRIEDPIYPLDLEVPDCYREAFETILAVMRTEDVITVGRLYRACATHLLVNAEDTLRWMLATGILLRMQPVSGWVPPEKSGRVFSEPLVEIERIDRMRTDFLVY